MTGEDRDKRRPTRRRRRLVRGALVLAVVVLALAFLAWQIREAGPARITEAILNASRPWVILAGVLTLSRFLIAAWRLGALTQRFQSCSKRLFVPIMLASQVVGLAVPGIRLSAALYRAFIAARHFGGSFALHLGPNLLDQFYLALAWLLVGAAFVPSLALSHDSEMPSRLPVFVAGGFLLLGGAFLLLRVYGGRLERWLARPRSGKRGKIANAGHTTLKGTGEFAAHPQVVVIGLVGGVAFVVASGLAQHAALVAVGASTPWWLALLTVAFGGVIGGATGAPGGVAVTEAAQTVFLASQGVPQDQAAASVLVARGLHYAVILAGGGSGLIWEWSRGHLRGALADLRSVDDDEA